MTDKDIATVAIQMAKLINKGLQDTSRHSAIEQLAKQIVPIEKGKSVEPVREAAKAPAPATPEKPAATHTPQGRHETK